MRWLSVPRFFQSKDKPYCGPTCAKMVLAFHGHRTTISKIVSEMNVTVNGVDMATLGNFFLEKGFDVKIKMFLPSFPNRFISLTDKINQEILQWCYRTQKDEENRIYRKTIPRFLEKGGVLIPRPFSFQELLAAIEKRCPPILNLNVATIYELKRFKKAGHYVVPTNITKDKITINDPSGHHGGTKTYPIELILHATYTWSAGAIFIEPKK